MIVSDIFIEIGESHKICEDYILKRDALCPYIILSDGCSSSKDTEMGARILCHLAKEYIRHQPLNSELNYWELGRWVIYNAEMLTRQLGLDKDCLDATLIVAYTHSDYVTVMMYGDGAVIVKDNEGNQRLIEINYTKNMPYYLSYLLDSELQSLYHKYKIEKIATDYSSKHLFYKTQYAYDYPTIFQYSIIHNEQLLILSDGISSFTKGGVEIDIFDLLSSFTSFKTKKGEYLQRRMKRALRDLKNDGITHYDDLSIGSFLLHEELKDVELLS